jgi:hypothetical protein
MPTLSERLQLLLDVEAPVGTVGSMSLEQRQTIREAIAALAVPPPVNGPICDCPRCRDVWESMQEGTR